jgi:type I restriction enzyme R subunit
VICPQTFGSSPTSRSSRRSGCARRELREDWQGLHRLSSARCERLSRFIVLEAKAEDKNPLVGKEQARKYAKSQNCRFVILSNGNLHYFWDLERGNPYVITAFPTPDSVIGYQKVTPDPQRLIDEVGDDYIVLTQRPNYAGRSCMAKRGRAPRLHPGQQAALPAALSDQGHPLPSTGVGEGKDRFLFEMATGTGKTLTAAAVIKLFLRSGNARRVLFLVDRLELEDQAKKPSQRCSRTTIKRSSTRRTATTGARAEIVVTTVQSLLFNNKYQKLFSPTDFDLVISDEAHRSIGGNARAVFDYFIGYKLGLTATPRDYLRRFDSQSPVPATRARPSAACCSTPTAPSAARTASRPSATRCSMA